MLACHKLSAGPRPRAVVFDLELVPIDGVRDPVPRLTVREEADIPAEAVFATAQTSARSPEQRRVIEQAQNFILTYLLEGPQRTKDLLAEAKAVGISVRTIERARADLRVIAYQQPNRTGKREWWLKLPPTPDTIADDWRTSND